MNDFQVSYAIATALRTQVPLELVHIYAHDIEVTMGSTVEKVLELQLPAVWVTTECRALCGSGTIGEAFIEIKVISQGDDETSATHSARTQAVIAMMADKSVLDTAATAIGGIKFLGKAARADNRPDVEQRAFVSHLSYKIGVQSL